MEHFYPCLVSQLYVPADNVSEWFLWSTSCEDLQHCAVSSLASCRNPEHEVQSSFNVMSSQKLETVEMRTVSEPAFIPSIMSRSHYRDWKLPEANLCE